jgi:RsiW-degrading membrane proteinase PrsW (M82 family)
MVQAAVALLPVLLFLIALVALDRFRLVHLHAVLLAVAAGAGAAAVSQVLQVTLLGMTDVAPGVFTRYIGPAMEETAKAAYILFLLRSGRTGFLVDAAIQGFAVGAGFGVVENIFYLRSMPDAPLLLWFVRGLGTAVLHGSATTLFALISKNLSDRSPDQWSRTFLPGLLAASVLHSTFNHLPLPPVAMTSLLLVAMPLLILYVFDRSERATREWVGAGMDLDLEVLSLVSSDAFGFTRFGVYLRQLAERFPGPVVADMFCLLRLELELSVQAKARLLAREAGLEIPIDEDLRASLDEIASLNRSIGPTGRLALKPLQVTTHRDDWHRHLLRQSDKSGTRKARSGLGQER